MLCFEKEVSRIARWSFQGFSQAVRDILGGIGQLWLGRPMAALDGRTPEQLLVANEFETIERIVWWLESGVSV